MRLEVSVISFNREYALWTMSTVNFIFNRGGMMTQGYSQRSQWLKIYHGQELQATVPVKSTTGPSRDGSGDSWLRAAPERQAIPSAAAEHTSCVAAFAVASGHGDMGVSPRRSRTMAESRRMCAEYSTADSATYSSTGYHTSANKWSGYSSAGCDCG